MEHSAALSELAALNADSNPDSLPPVAPMLPRSPETLADLLVLLELWTDWPAETRRIMGSHIRTCALIATATRLRASGRTDPVQRRDVLPTSIPCAVGWLNDHLFRYPAKLVGLTNKAQENAITGLRRALRRLGLIEPAATPALAPEGAWSKLLDALAADAHCRLGLGRFAAWCEAEGIPPQAVTPEMLAGFEAFVRTRLLHGDIPGLMRTVAKAWRKAAKLAADWPTAVLAPAVRRQPYTLPFSAFPASLQADIDRFARRLTGGGGRGPFRAEGPARPLRPSSIKARLFSLRQAISALVLLGRDPMTITSLADLVEETAFEAVLQFYWERHVTARIARGELEANAEPPPDAGVSAQTGAIATALMMVARHHCKLDAEALERLAGMAADVTPPRQARLTRKNRDRLRQFDDRAVRLRLLNLPQRLMREAEQMMARMPRRAAQLARSATALELLLHIPLRVGNLTRLRLGHELKYRDTRTGQISRLALTADQTKNRNDVEWAVGPELNAFLQRYIRTFRPRLAAPGSDFLFPACATRMGPISTEGMRYGIRTVIAREVGAEVNPHLFRSLFARLTLEDSPGALEDVRLVLGDKSMAVVLAHYSALEPSVAAGRCDEVLRRARAHAARRPARPSAGKGARR